jgi:DNA-binding IclR family transcriptional regulator
MSPTHAPETPERRRRVQSAEMGLSVLKALGRLGGAAGLTSIAAEVGELPPKVHRYLASLLQEGFVSQDAATQHYQLGPEALQLGLIAIRRTDIVRASDPALLRLRDHLGLTCMLGVVGNMGPTIVRWEEPVQPVTVNVRVGSVMPVLWSATGRVCLAYSKDARLLRTATAELACADADQRAQLDAHRPIEVLCDAVRRHGCATTQDTIIKGLGGVAVPILDFNGRLCAAIAALGSVGSIDLHPEGNAAMALKQEAQRLSAELGYSQHRPERPPSRH